MQEQMALESAAFSVAVLDELPNMVRVIDEQGEVLYINSAFKKRFEKLQQSPCRRIPGATSDCIECIALKCISEQRRFSYIARALGRIFSICTSPVKYNDRVYALEIFADITQEQNMKDKLMATNTRMMKDLEIARSLQLSILRHNLPALDGYSFAAEFLPCDALGGDMYDCFMARDGRIFMYIADVSGHGVMPAMLTVYLRQEMFAQCKTSGITPAEVLKNIQISFEELNTEESIYITIFVLSLNPETGEFVCANAGHSVPPLIAKQDGIHELFLPGTPICRWVDSANHEQVSGVLNKGEKLFLYTDGLDGIHTGEVSNQKLSDILLDQSLKGKELLGEIKKQFTQMRADDVTMLLCERSE